MSRTIVWKALRYFFPILFGVIYLLFISMFLGLARWQSAIVVGSGSILIWAGTFTVLEVQRIERAASGRGPEELVRQEKRIVVVEPPTGEPYPHHEDYACSPGKDQGQLTSSSPETTPLIDRWPVHSHGRS